MERKVVLNLKFKNDEKKNLIIDGNEYIINKHLQTMNGVFIQSNHLYNTFGVKGKEIFNKCIIKSVTESIVEGPDEKDPVKNISLLLSFKSFSKQ